MHRFNRTRFFNGRLCRRRRGRGVLIAVVLALLSASVGAATAQQLYAPLKSVTEQSQNRCEWVNDHFAHLDHELSMYRNDIRVWQVRVNGRIARHKQAVEVLEFNSFLFGANRLRFIAPSELARQISRGDLVEVGFIDGRSVYHPAFCGSAASLMASSDTTVQVVVIQPRTRSVWASSGTYSDLKITDVLELVFQRNGLQLVNQTQSSFDPIARLIQRNEVDWRFAQRIASDHDLGLRLETNAVYVSEDGFTPPVQTGAGTDWENMSWLEVAEEIAGLRGYSTNIQVAENFDPVLKITQAVPDMAFIQNLAHQHGYSAYISGNTLYIRADGVWQNDPNVRSVRGARVTLASILGATAERYGLGFESRLTKSVYVNGSLLGENHAVQAYRLAGRHGTRLTLAGKTLVLSASLVEGDVSEVLDRRILVSGGGVRRPTFARAYTHPQTQIVAPGSAPTVEVTLILPRKTRSSAVLPADKAADKALIANRLSRAYRRLVRNTPVEVFRAKLLDIYLPSVLGYFQYNADQLK